MQVKVKWPTVLKVVIINDEIIVAYILYYEDRNDQIHTDVFHI
jgi:hypothetical protein